MPLFPRRSTPKEKPKTGTQNNNNNNHEPCYGNLGNANEEDDREKLVFYCQQAQGSPTGIISGFNNVKELYQRISECYDFDSSEILFCTLNTHKINMTRLLGAHIALNDLIFVHRKGRPKEVELTKKEEALGLTITDNGNGLAFIKKIKPGSVIDAIPVIQVGDHIEKINNESLVGKRHFEVAKCLKDIPLGTTFTLRLISPLQAGFYNIGPREERGKGKKAHYGSGKETLRFKAEGSAVVEVLDDTETIEKAVDGINELLENYLGINDSELGKLSLLEQIVESQNYSTFRPGMSMSSVRYQANRIWELSQGKKNSLDFLQALSDSDLNELGFSDDFIFEIWGVITDVRDGRL